MKIIELSINQFRGIINLTLNFNGNNAVVYGDNGTGKSGVVDAVDYLFTGKISRLGGVGAQGLSLASHGVHVKGNINEAFVSAKIKLKNIEETIQIRRELKNSKKLIYDKKYTSQIEEICKLAESQIHFLSRREILKFINSTPGDRAAEIQALLNFDILETNRIWIQKLTKDKAKEHKTLETALNENKNKLSKLLNYSEEDWLVGINELRNKLNSNDVSELLSEEILKDISIEEKIKEKTRLSNTIILIDKIKKFINKASPESLFGIINNIKQLRNKIAESYEIIKDAKYLTLLKNSSVLIEDKTCPLCEQQIIEKDLIEIIAERLKKISFLDESNLKINLFAKKINSIIGEILSNYKNLINQPDLDEAEHNYIKICINKIDLLSKENFEKTEDFRLIEILLDEIYDAELFEKYYQTLLIKSTTLAFDSGESVFKKLVEVKSILETILSCSAKININALTLGKLQFICENYIKYQNIWLNNIYKSIETRFSELYKIIHADDESSFSAELNQASGSLELLVDFHNIKKYPPNAVHSEGHQDSMGICLFLALSEKLSNEKFNIIVLDDVVMSIDNGHRINFCKILREIFPSKQFVITTHDFIWHRELEHQCIVDRNNIFHFKAWNIDNGPFVSKSIDIWDDINSNLSKGNKEVSISLLRNHMEESFAYFCELYKLKVPYSLEAKWMLADVMQPVYKVYKEAFGLAIDTAVSYKNEHSAITALKTKMTELYSLMRADEWCLNPLVHFTAWAKNLSIQELKKLIESVKNYLDFFICETCNSYIKLRVDINQKAEMIFCNCGRHNFSCEKMKSAQKLG